MNNSVALLYNFNEEKLKMIKMVCMMMQGGLKRLQEQSMSSRWELYWEFLE